MTAKEIFDGIVNEISNVDEMDFKEQLNILKKWVTEASNSNELREIFRREASIKENNKFGDGVQKIKYLVLYFRGDEEEKDNDGKLRGTGLWYILLSEEKKKEFVEVANELLKFLESNKVI